MIDSRVCSAGPAYQDACLHEQDRMGGFIMKQRIEVDEDAALEDASTWRCLDTCKSGDQGLPLTEMVSLSRVLAVSLSIRQTTRMLNHASSICCRN
jgi:hypothetical protein